MAIDVGNDIVRAIAGEAARRVFSQFKSPLFSGKNKSSAKLETAISRHIKYVHSWSEKYNLLGLSAPKNSRSDTIPLRLSDVPRRYRGDASRSSSHEVHEDAFLVDTEPCVLLGDPGAGKTTTLKRLCLRLITEEPEEGEAGLQLPIVIILREIGDNHSVIPHIAQIFSLKAERSIDDDISSANYKIDGEDATEALSQILDATSSLLIIDGLDEIPQSSRASVERELELLSAYSRKSKIIVSCRSGDYNRALHGFHTFELMPLSRSEVIDISSTWIDRPSDFIDHLESKPYKDIVDRPLLLSFLLFLFKNEGGLPPRPSLIYRKVVYRLLKDWDDERRIKRGSAYADFDPDVKIDFLSEFSYLLTYKLKQKGFNDSDAIEIISEIASSYGLPLGQQVSVLGEIETHTGIVVSAGFNRFEFAHLSVQEYLCANFISRSPVPEFLRLYLTEYPAPVAVACALSSQPGIFIHQMIKRHLVDKFRNPEDFFYSIEIGNQLTFDLFGSDTSNTLTSFLTRLELEQPIFRASPEFGEALLLLFAFYYRRYNKKIDDAIDKLASSEFSQEALRMRFANSSWKAISLTRHTAALNIDQLFISIYEEIAGPWPRSDPKAKILPIALIPKRILSSAGIAVVPTDEAEEDLIFIKRNISGTPFCMIESGKHRRRSSNSSCEICGNNPYERTHRKGKMQRYGGYE
ncbi:hypothetical protein DMC47_42200 [Nostoc sp. 3335mG]|nr:hypothetical protein DMC47_42200 [Nostoc sp. 3335mG]